MTKPTNTLVTLTVDTSTINETNKNDKVTFTDDQSDPAENPGHPDQYVSTVNKNAWITWKGVSDNGTDTVNISKVEQKTTGGGSDILVVPIGNPNDGEVKARVKNSQVTGDECYNVKFNINGSTTEYCIDPKLRMN